MIDGCEWHLPLIVGLSLVPAVERFTGQLWDRPAALGVLMEIVTAAARLALVVVVFRAAVTRWSWASARTFARDHWRSLLWQWAMIGALFVVADIVPEQVIPTLVDVGPLYMAVLLAIKNVTVIPFTMIWLVGIVRQAGSPAGATANA